MRKNDKYIVDIIDMGMDGEGIAKVDGEVVFVPFAIKGEKVEILIINTKSKFAIAKVINILEPSPLRKTPLCPYFTKCGGCELQHIGYNNQLILKKNSLVTTLAKNGINHIVSDVVPCESEYRYRNKVALPVAMINGKTVIGMYRKGSHKIVEIDDCIIQMDFIKKLLEVSKSYIEANNISGYDEEKLSGDLRHIVARHYGDSILVTLVATKKNLPNIKDYYDRLKEVYSNVGLSINVNTKKTNVIFGDTNIHIAGSEELHICENDIKYSVSNTSFMQVNDDVRNKIYKFVLDSIDDSDTIVDLYSGAGVLTAMLSRKAKQVYGVEIVASAVDNANNLMKNNNISNVTNICGDAEIELKKLSKVLSGDFSIVVDPPRKGLGESVSKMLCELSPKKIIYVSCNPATLSRDLKIMSDKYEILSINPFDMFPQTKHLETVAILKRI